MHMDISVGLRIGPAYSVGLLYEMQETGHLYGQALANESPSSQKYFRHVALLNSRN